MLMKQKLPVQRGDWQHFALEDLPMLGFHHRKGRGQELGVTRCPTQAIQTTANVQVGRHETTLLTIAFPARDALEM